MSGKWNRGRASGTSARGNLFIEMICTILSALLESEDGERLQTQLRLHSSAEVWFSSSIVWPSGKQWQGSQERRQPGAQGHCGCCGYHSTATSEAPKEGGCYVGNGRPPKTCSCPNPVPKGGLLLQL